MTRRDVSIPPIALDRDAADPLHQQVSRQIARAIRTGAIRGGVRLPSSRWMSKLLGISRNTVLVAYDELVAEGLLLGKRGAGMQVAQPGRSPAPLSGLRRVIREAGYPANILAFEDEDGNLLYLNF